MLSIYYKIWVDAIVFEQTKNGERRNWKIFTLFPISILQGVNLLTIFFVAGAITKKNIPIFFDVSIFHIKPLDAFISFSITLFWPFVFLNYFSIIYNNRYEGLVEKYRYHGGRLYLTYFLLTIGVFIIPIFIGILTGLY
jgi:hypothetical protein